MEVVVFTDMPVGSDVTENVKIPKSGDANRAWLWGLLGITSLIGLCSVCIYWIFRIKDTQKK